VTSSQSTDAGSERCATPDQRNPGVSRLLGSQKVLLAHYTCNGEHPDITALREQLGIHGGQELLEHGEYHVYNFWCHGRGPGRQNNRIDGIRGIYGEQPDYVYIVRYSQQECHDNKARIAEYGQLVRTYCGRRSALTAEQHGRVDFVSPFASFDETNLHHFVRCIGYVVKKATSGYVFWDPGQGLGFKKTIYELDFATHKEGLNLKQYPDYTKIGDTLSVVLQYDQALGRGFSTVTGQKIIFKAPSYTEKNKSACREILHEFKPHHNIYRYAEDYINRNEYAPRSTPTVTQGYEIQEEIRAGYTRDHEENDAQPPAQDYCAGEWPQPEPEAESQRATAAREEDEEEEEGEFTEYERRHTPTQNEERRAPSDVDSDFDISDSGFTTPDFSVLPRYYTEDYGGTCVGNNKRSRK
jgi:hypothetical protein